MEREMQYPEKRGDIPAGITHHIFSYLYIIFSKLYIIVDGIHPGKLIRQALNRKPNTLLSGGNYKWATATTRRSLPRHLVDLSYGDLSGSCV